MHIKSQQRNWTMGAFVTILNRSNRILCVRQRYSKRNWTTPGGRIEDGEDPVEALRRETREEVGLNITNVRFTGIYWKSYARDLVFSFAANSKLDDFTFKANSEISDAAFFDISNLPSPMRANTRLRIEHAATRVAAQLTIFRTPTRYRVIAGDRSA